MPSSQGTGRRRGLVWFLSKYLLEPAQDLRIALPTTAHGVAHPAPALPPGAARPRNVSGTPIGRQNIRKSVRELTL
jgi:hypothetical protein